MKNVGSNKKGFTIIEVVLVLAVAGLIFLIVFLAVPALQSNRRDTQRRSDLGRFIAQLESYASNNNGNYPTQSTVGQFVNNYMTVNNAVFRDPSADSGTYTIAGTANNTVGTIHYAPGRTCNGENANGSGQSRSIAASIKLEAGRYCQDNQ